MGYRSNQKKNGTVTIRLEADPTEILIASSPTARGMVLSSTPFTLAALQEFGAAVFPFVWTPSSMRSQTRL